MDRYSDDARRSSRLGQMRSWSQEISRLLDMKDYRITKHYPEKQNRFGDIRTHSLFKNWLSSREGRYACHKASQELAKERHTAFDKFLKAFNAFLLRFR